MIHRYGRDAPVKKTIALVMALVLMLALAGCGPKDDPQNNPSPAPDQNGVFSPLDPNDNNLDDNLDDKLLTGSPAPTQTSPATLPGVTGPQGTGGDEPLGDPDDDPLSAATPAPTPTLAPVIGLAIKDYQYETYTDEALGLSLKYPSHWTVDATSNTVSFEEPVSSGVPMRLALSVKSYEDKLSTAQAKQEFTDYLNAIKGGYSKFQKGKVDTKVSFMNRRACNCQYQAQHDGPIIRGYVIMCNVEQSKQIVVLHFSAPKDKYNKTSRKMFQQVMFSVTRLTGNNS